MWVRERPFKAANQRLSGKKHKKFQKIGYNEKYPSGLRNVILCPPLRITLTFDVFPPEEPNDLAITPAK